MINFSVLFSVFQLLAVFMQMGACELLIHYMDLKQTNDVQLAFEALKVTFLQLTYNASQLFKEEHPSLILRFSFATCST